MLNHSFPAPPAATRVRGIGRNEANRLLSAPLEESMAQARAVRARRSGNAITYSRKVFAPLTNLCRDRCAYCTFAQPIGDPAARTMTPDDVLAVARAGRRAGCKEILFSLGDKPELRYPAYREWLSQQGVRSTVEYLAAMCQLVFEETGLLPHANAGVLTRAEIDLLKPVNASLGLMLESTSDRLLAPGEAHFQCPDKAPALRLQTLRDAGEAGVAFTTGILLGIGETASERLDALFAIRDLHERHGHIQEVIVQNFRAKAGTLFAKRVEPSLEDLQRTAAIARLIFAEEIAVQVPPNLSPESHADLLDAGIDDWGGVSPVTLDYINPERAWPKLAELRDVTARAGFELRERLAVHPRFALEWMPRALQDRAAEWIGDGGFVRRDRETW